MPPMDEPIDNEPPMDDQPDMNEPIDTPVGPEQDGNDMDSINGGQDESQLQKLSGELSQELRDYNQSHPDDEQGMNKYVLGMISSAAAGNLKSSEIKKIKANLEGDGGGDDMDGDIPENPDMQEGRRSLNHLIDEIVNGVMDTERKQTSKRDGKKLNKRFQNDRNNPFISQW